MAFTLNNWSCVSASLSQGQETITPFGGSPTVENSPNLFTYGSPNDTAAQIGASNYFLPQYASLSVGDWILGFGTDTSFMYQVTAVSSTSVTVESIGAISSVGTSSIINNAVTYAKLQEASAGNVLLGNPTGSAANYEQVTLGNLLQFSGTALEVNPEALQVIEVSLTAAQWNGMYATPVQIIPAGGGNTIIIVDSMVLTLFYGTTQFTGGGVVGLQYGATDHLGGPPASATEAAADFTGASASTAFRIGGGLSTGAPYSTTSNAAVYLSNASAPFATGDSTFKCWVWYKIIPTNS
jgi:hypothetical protein